MDRIISVAMNIYDNKKPFYFHKPQNGNTFCVSLMIVPITVKDLDGFVWKSSTQDSGLKAVVWDDGEYILSISGNYAENEPLNLAKNAKVL